MRRRWVVLGVLGTSALSAPLWAQDVPSVPLERQLRQEKTAYYAQIEYQRCRSDIVELLVKAEPLEKRIKELEDEVRKLTEDLTALRSASHEAKPAN